MDKTETISAVIEKVFACFKKITPALLATSLTAGSLLFLPQKVLERLGVHKLPEIARIITGILFLLSTVLIITIGVSLIWQFVARKIKCVCLLHNLKKRFFALAPEQKEILADLLQREDKVISLDIASGNARYLQDKGFIYRPAQMFSLNSGDEMYVKFVPYTWLIDLYNNKPDLFK